MKTSFAHIIALSIAGIALTGCDKSSSPKTSESPTTQPAAAKETKSPAKPSAEPAAKSPAKPAAKAIVLPDGWKMEQAISVADVEAVVGQSGYQTFPEASSSAASGKPSGAFTKASDPQLKLTFIANVKGTEKMYEGFKGYAVEGSVKEVKSDLWDKAYVADFTDSSAAIVVLKGDVCIRINWFPKAYPAKPDLGAQLAAKLIRNLYGS